MISTIQLIDVFQDTCVWCQKNEKLKRIVTHSIQDTRLYKENEYPTLPDKNKETGATKIEISHERTFQAAFRLAKEEPNSRIAVLNFASAVHPGGGVTSGSRAQEEGLCRCSTLYPVLVQDSLSSPFYLYHKRRHDCRYTDRCLYTPDVYVIKTDTSLPQRLPEKDWIKVDVLTCAAPNLHWNPSSSEVPRSGRSDDVSDKELLEIHLRRARHLLTIAAHHRADTLILGAFGCGAFRNNPWIVAKAYRAVLPEFDGRFHRVLFAIYAKTSEAENFRAFSEVLLA